MHILLEWKRIITPEKHNTTQLKFKTPAVFTAEGDKLCIPIPFPKVTPQQAWI